MLKHFLKIALRNAFKNKSLNLINLVGMAISFAVGFYILLYVNFETSYDHFHPAKDRIFRVVTDRYQDNNLAMKDAFTVPALGPALKDEIPSVQDYFRVVQWANNYTFLSESKATLDVSFKAKEVAFVDPAFLKYFQLDFISGSKSQALNQPNQFIISSSLASRIFGVEWAAQAPVGKIFSVYNSNQDQVISVTLAGIYQDFPQNTHLKYEVLFSHSTLPGFLPKEIPEPQRLSMFETSWGPPSWYTYIVMNESAKPLNVAEKITQTINHRNKIDQANKVVYHLQPIREIYLHSDLSNEANINGNIQQLYLLIGVAAIIMIIASINFINLTTSIGFNRIKEISIRKVAGAGKKSIFYQFITESGFLIGLSLLLALLIISFSHLVVPWNWHFIAYFSHFSWIGLGLFFFILLLLLGSVFLIVQIFGSLPHKTEKQAPNRNSMLQKGLVVTQFVIALLLISGSYTIYKQVNFMKNQQLGLDLEQVLVVENPNLIDDDFGQMIQTLRNNLNDYNTIEAVTAVNILPGNLAVNFIKMIRKGQDPSSAHSIKDIRMDPVYLQTMEAQLLAGKYLDDQNYQGKVILNKAAMDALGFSNPEKAINKKISILNAWGTEDYEVAGVVANFHQRSLKQQYEPMAFFPGIATGNVLIKFNLNKEALWSDQLEIVKQEWKEVFGGNPFAYYFLDQHFNQQYQQDQQFGYIFNLFSIIAIIISGMGLLGLTINALHHRMKEISIRKVLGASLFQLFSLMIKQYIFMVLLAAVIFVPLAYYFIGVWLNNFAFRIALNVSFFLLPALILLFTGLLFIFGQIYKASVVNPVETLKNE
ncbi:MAG: ABC transporter permease [Candidatus Cyclobacteriaceae bacterium M3_2C_046]